MLSFAIPGTVIGVAYVIAFNVPPIELTGTGIILVLSFIFRNMPVGVRAGIASMSQIDRSLDEASLTLRGRALADAASAWCCRCCGRRSSARWSTASCAPMTDDERRHLPGHGRLRAWRRPTSSAASRTATTASPSPTRCVLIVRHAGGHRADAARGRRAPARPPRAADGRLPGRPRVSVEFRRDSSKRVIKAYGHRGRRASSISFRRGRHAGDAARPLGLRQDHDACA